MATNHDGLTTADSGGSAIFPGPGDWVNWLRVARALRPAVVKRAASRVQADFPSAFSSSLIPRVPFN